jgi:tight adherence protein B
MINFDQMLLLVGEVAAVVLVLFLVARNMLDRRRAFWERRLRGEGGDEATPMAGDVTVPAPPADWAGKMDVAFDSMVQRTGLPLNTGQALGVIFLSGVLLAGVVLLWRTDWLAAGAGLVLGMALPLVVLLFLQARWRRRMQDQLPDALFLLARFLRAGMSLDQALAMVGRHGTRPLAEVFRRCSEQIELGLTVPAALQLTAQRVRLADFNVFVSVVTMYRSTGGNLAQLLDRVAASTRDRNQFRGYFRAATALGRITGLFMSAAPLLLFLGYWVWQPDYLARFFESPSGLTALGVAAILELIGVAWLWWLLRVTY